MNTTENINSDVRIWDHVKIPQEGTFVLVFISPHEHLPYGCPAKSKDYLISLAEAKQGPYYSSLKIYNHLMEEIWPVAPVTLGTLLKGAV